MKNIQVLRNTLLGLCMGLGTLQAQDTFSIVAIDSVTGEVGSAGASCVNMIFFPSFPTDFLGELFPGLGAINSQAYYLEANQANAALRMEAGDTPQEIIDWLVANDVEGNPDIRQYGVVAFVDGSPESAAHTGSFTDDYKGHRTGANYSIQGNILLGPEILDSMEARFLQTEGDLACKLMAAMQGANVVGADTRCAGYGTSSLFAFLKVAAPGDAPGEPSLLVAVETGPAAGIEPIDSLQTLFDAAYSCSVGTGFQTPESATPILFPNPVHTSLQLPDSWPTDTPWQIIDLNGAIRMTGTIGAGGASLNVSELPAGIYWIKAGSDRIRFVKT